MKQTLNIAIIVLVSSCAWLAVSNNDRPWSDAFNYKFGEPSCECNTEDITDMYSDYISEWKSGISESFDKAESEVYEKDPTPDVVGPDPDPKKCICGGSGVITQGDGHKTPCPYHGKKMSMKVKDKNLIYKPLLIVE